LYFTVDTYRVIKKTNYSRQIKLKRFKFLKNVFNYFYLSITDTDILYLISALATSESPGEVFFVQRPGVPTPSPTLLKLIQGLVLVRPAPPSAWGREKSSNLDPTPPLP
jgi:hypothetical protein